MLQLYERVGMKIPRQTNSEIPVLILEILIQGCIVGVFLFVKGKGSACKTGYYQTR